MGTNMIRAIRTSVNETQKPPAMVLIFTTARQEQPPANQHIRIHGSQ
ncbi:MAG: hypothetical protein WC379_09030 [Methanoregula sp.]|jgi:hypothetical protein